MFSAHHFFNSFFVNSDLDQKPGSPLFFIQRRRIYDKPLKAPNTTAADNEFCNIFSNFQKKIRFVISIELFLMKYHALFVILEKAAKFEIVICYKLKVALYGLRNHTTGLAGIM